MTRQRQPDGRDEDRQARLRDALVEALAALDAGDEAAVGAALQRITDFGNHQLVQGIASITRSVHDALRELDGDGRLAAAAGWELTDTRGRLSRVVALTQDAATRTLAEAERIVALCGDGDRSPEEPDPAERLARIRQAAGEIVLAQSYQDLTGQLVGRAIELIALVEQRLVALLLAAGVRPPRRQAGGSELQGPAFDGGGADVLQSQDEVDALLQSLGA